jgi:hypothetical protein
MMQNLLATNTPQIFYISHKNTDEAKYNPAPITISHRTNHPSRKFGILKNGMYNEIEGAMSAKQHLLY